MPSEEFESAAASFKRAGQDAVTHARRVAGNAVARSRRHHSENAELLKRGGRGTKPGDPTRSPVVPGARREANQTPARVARLPKKSTRRRAPKPVRTIAKKIAKRGR